PEPEPEHEQAPAPEPAPEPAPAPEPTRPADPVDMALQRARQAESVAPAQPEQPRQPAQPQPQSSFQNTAPSPTARNERPAEELSGWRARRAKIDARRNTGGPGGFGGPGAGPADNGGFNGVPLPDEPSEPWDDGPGAVPPDPEGQQGVDRAEAEEAMAQLNDPSSANIDHRNAIEIAGELLEKHLGAERTR
ncbi:MAG: hypothetical protein ACTHVU_13835, partial [Corynebacterium sp.]